jgi:hypothetical protein
MMDLRSKFLACTVLLLLNVVSITVCLLNLGLIGLFFAGLFLDSP